MTEDQKNNPASTSPEDEKHKEKNKADRPAAASIKTGHDVVRWLAITLLFGAACLKAYFAATGPLPTEPLFQTRGFTASLIALELALACILILNWQAIFFTIAAAITFGIFAIYALHGALIGKTSCGCFGDFQVHPWIMFSIDTVMFCLLLWFMPRKNDKIPPSFFKVHVRSVAGIVLLGVIALWQIFTFESGTIDTAGQIIGNESIVILEPEEWVGKKFPLANYVTVDADLLSGRWIVVLFHHDCPSCRKAIPKFEQIATNAREDASLPQVVLVEMPPYARPEHYAYQPATSACTSGKLDESREWFATTPTEIHLEDGIVISPPTTSQISKKLRSTTQKQIAQRRH